MSLLGSTQLLKHWNQIGHNHLHLSLHFAIYCDECEKLVSQIYITSLIRKQTLNED